MVGREKWVWMPHAGHFIRGNKCLFRLNTWIPCERRPMWVEQSYGPPVDFSGGAIVSTVGEYWPDREVRAIHAQVRGVEIRGRGNAWDADYMAKFGYMEIGTDRLYETMVFPAKPEYRSCCPHGMASPRECDFHGYDNAEEAFAGHTAMCEAWAEKLGGGDGI